MSFFSGASQLSAGNYLPAMSTLTSLAAHAVKTFEQFPPAIILQNGRAVNRGTFVFDPDHSILQKPEYFDGLVRQ